MDDMNKPINGANRQHEYLQTGSSLLYINFNHWEDFLVKMENDLMPKANGRNGNNRKTNKEAMCLAFAGNNVISLRFYILFYTDLRVYVVFLE